MGFTVAEALEFPKFGLSASECYITIKGAYSQDKWPYSQPMMPMPMPMQPTEDNSGYILSARYYIYANSEYSGLQFLSEDWIRVKSDSVLANPFAAIYAEIKSTKFAGKTITDDL